MRNVIVCVSSNMLGRVVHGEVLDLATNLPSLLVTTEAIPMERSKQNCYCEINFKLQVLRDCIVL